MSVTLLTRKSILFQHLRLRDSPEKCNIFWGGHSEALLSSAFDFHKVSFT